MQARSGRTPPPSAAAERRRADLALVAAFLRGEPAAERQLIEQLLPHIKGACRTLMRSGADVDDALQVSLMRVLEGLAGYRGDAGLDRWARRVTINACLRLIAQRRRYQQPIEDGADVERVPSPRSSERLVDAIPRRVSDYLDRLSEEQRQVIVLRHVYEYSVREIAELLGARVDTVKSRLLYGRRNLRRLVRRDVAIGAGSSIEADRQEEAP
ncbi:MAG: sigma-70 family RNA polymerase sigma factor [Myxococcales bacterium]|nr:sigma-70 family RNA polymerase sigma factor [Myxococcales bacterium]